jgi:hypothetical protein
MATKKNVKFIRRKGKIIPIRTDKKVDTKRVAKGAGLAALGLASAEIGGRKLAKTLKKSDQALRISKKFQIRAVGLLGPLFDSKYGSRFQINLRKSEKFAKMGGKLSKNVFKLNTAFEIASSALIGTGIARSLKALNVEESAADISGDVAGLGTYAYLRASSKKALSGTPRYKTLIKSFKEAGKKALKFAIKKRYKVGL